MGRNAGHALGYFDYDGGFFKSFALPFRESTLQFRAELFNATNRTNFSAPNSDLSSSAFGTISGALDPREIQLGLKLSF